MKTILILTASIALTCLTVAADDNRSSNMEAVPVGTTNTDHYSNLYYQYEAPVLKVLTAEDHGATYRAYVVKLKGCQVPVADNTISATDTKEGEQLTIDVVRQDPGKNRSLFLRFTAHSTATQLTGLRLPAPGATAMPRPGPAAATNTNGVPDHELAQAKVLQVFAVEDNQAKFRAYLVQWKGFDIVVSDLLAQTDAKEGDLLKFMASRSSGMFPPTLHFSTRDYTRDNLARPK